MESEKDELWNWKNMKKMKKMIYAIDIFYDFHLCFDIFAIFAKITIKLLQKSRIKSLNYWI